MKSVKIKRNCIFFVGLALFLQVSCCFAQEQITGFEAKDLPVLNDRLTEIDKKISQVVPAGVIQIWTTDTAPDGWLLCYGQAISRIFYVGLFNVIGTVYGAGDSSTTFNLPDMRGRFPLGQDDMGGTSANRVTDTDADTLGGSDGTETIDTSLGNVTGSTTLTSSQSGVPVHTHPQQSNTLIEAAGSLKSGSTFGTTGGTTQNNTAADAASGHTHSLSGGSSTQSVQNNFLTLNYIIKI